MRSLKEAGLNSLPPFIGQSDLEGRVFEIVDATSRDSQYGPEVVFQLRVLDDGERGPWIYTQDGDPVFLASWSASYTPGANGQREQFVKHFRANPGDTLGPCLIEWIPTQGGNPFARIIDAPAIQEGTVTAAASLPAPTTRTASPPKAAAATRRATRHPEPPQRPDDDDALPF